MKIIIAPDSFKGSLSSIEAIEIISSAIKSNWGEQEIIKVPVADGGEGTADALVTAAGGHFESAQVSGGMGEEVTAKYGVIYGDTAVIEMAAIAGLATATENDPLKATSRGLGDMIALVLKKGFKKVLVGIGGSMSNDGGMGMLAALGAEFRSDGELLYGRGEDLERVTDISLQNLIPELESADINVICDVTNPLLGPNGATYIYGPQKGAVGEIGDRLEAGMENYAAVFEKQLGMDIVTLSGAGAAGGVGAALGGVLKARMSRGIDAVMDAVRFDELLQGASLVITGEGRLDAQSVKFGKVPAGIAMRCAQKEIPVAVIVGGLGDGWQDIYSIAKCSVMTLSDSPMSLEKSMSDAPRLLAGAADRMIRFISLMDSTVSV
ncbi:MAG: glycerate kinase [Christensenellales bacterium]|jgi:glycerate kinase